MIISRPKMIAGLVKYADPATVEKVLNYVFPSLNERNIASLEDWMTTKLTRYLSSAELQVLFTWLEKRKSATVPSQALKIARALIKVLDEDKVMNILSQEFGSEVAKVVIEKVRK